MRFGKCSAPRKPMTRREVVQLTINGELVYFAKGKGAQYTPDINRAAVYRHPHYAANLIMVRREQWKLLNPRVVSAWSIEGYVDKPSRTARREATR